MTLVTGRDPFAQGIFNKTEVYEDELEVSEERTEPETINQILDEKTQEPEASSHKPDSGFLQERGARDKITFQFPVDLNEWIDDLVRNGKKRHGHKIQK